MFSIQEEITVTTLFEKLDSKAAVGLAVERFYERIQNDEQNLRHYWFRIIYP